MSSKCRETVRDNATHTHRDWPKGPDEDCRTEGNRPKAPHRQAYRRPTDVTAAQGAKPRGSDVVKRKKACRTPTGRNGKPEGPCRAEKHKAGSFARLASHEADGRLPHRKGNRGCGQSSDSPDDFLCFGHKVRKARCHPAGATSHWHQRAEDKQKVVRPIVPAD